MRVAVTGASGFIGSHLVERLLADQHEVTALVRNSAQARILAKKGVAAIIGDITDAAAMRKTLSGCEIAFGLARAKAHGARPFAEVTAVNVTGARNVALESARIGAHVIHAGSTAVYGSRIASQPANEDAPIFPDSTYARSKLAGEDAVRAACGRATILRISAVLGPRCHSWLPLFRSAANGALRLAGDGKNLHHPVDVADVVDVLMLCAVTTSAHGRTYNVAGPDPITIRKLVDLMASVSGSHKSQPRPVPKLAVDGYIAIGKLAESTLGLRVPRMESILFLTGDRSFDVSRARNEVGFIPRIDTESAVQRTAEFYRREGKL